MTALGLVQSAMKLGLSLLAILCFTSTTAHALSPDASQENKSNWGLDLNYILVADVSHLCGSCDRRVANGGELTVHWRSNPKYHVFGGAYLLRANWDWPSNRKRRDDIGLMVGTGMVYPHQGSRWRIGADFTLLLGRLIEEKPEKRTVDGVSLNFSDPYVTRNRSLFAQFGIFADVGIFSWLRLRWHFALPLELYQGECQDLLTPYYEESSCEQRFLDTKHRLSFLIPIF